MLGRYSIYAERQWQMTLTGAELGRLKGGMKTAERQKKNDYPLRSAAINKGRFIMVQIRKRRRRCCWRSIILDRVLNGAFHYTRHFSRFIKRWLAAGEPVVTDRELLNDFN